MEGDSSGLRRAGSLALLAAILAGWSLYLYVPRPVEGRSAPRPPADYHRPAEVEQTYGPCAGCHGSAPHRRPRGVRAFLNLHTPRLECGVCHLRAEGVTLRRLPSAGNRIVGGLGEGANWAPALWPEQAAEFRPSGPPCGECHRRGSPILATGLFDAYRQRVLEEPNPLFRLDGGP